MSIPDGRNAGDIARNPQIGSIEDEPDGREHMDRAELIARASPPCRECGSSVQRVEIPWRLDEQGQWKPGPSFMICGDGHRVLIEPLL
jgi:hypothetical protein